MVDNIEVNTQNSIRIESRVGLSMLIRLRSTMMLMMLIIF